MWNELKIVDFNELVRRFNCDCGGSCNFCKHHLPEHSEDKTRCAVLNSLPSIDAVEVVRCKDCGYFLEEKLLCTHEGNMVFNTGKTTYPNCFCSYGERRGEDEAT